MKTIPMKTALLNCMAALLCLSTNAQTPTWAWAIDTNGPQNEYIKNIATTANGTIYAVGEYNGAFTIGELSFEAPVPTSQFGYAPFVSKISAAGEVEWTVTYGDPEGGYFFLDVSGVGADSDDNVYIAGMVFRGDLVGSFTVDVAGASFMFPQSSFGDGFIAKIDPDGNGLWVRHLSTQEHPGWGTGNKIVVDEYDHIYWQFGFQMNTLEIDGNIHYNMGSTDLFLAQLHPDGVYNWSMTIGTEGPDGGGNISPAAGGGILMSSTWTGEVVEVGGLTVTNPEPLIGQNPDRWIAKIDPAGFAEWLVREGGPGNEGAGVLTTTPDGGAMVLSHVSDPITLNGETFAQLGTVLSRYSNTGELQMATHYPGSQIWTFRIASDGNDQYYLGLSYASPTFAIGSFVFTNAGGLNGTADMVIAGIDANGTPLWAVDVGGPEFEMVISLDYNENQGPLVAGRFVSSPLNFGSTTVTNTGFLTNDLFVASMDFTSSIVSTAGVAQLHLFPNPAASHITADLGAFSAEQHTLRIFDTRGALVQTQAVTGGTLHTIEVGHLPAGNYVALIQHMDTVYAAKFVKL